MNKLKIKSGPFNALLSNVHLGGIINECLLEIGGGEGSIEAIDITNSLIVVTKGILTSDKDISETFGLGNLDLLIKFISTLNQDEIAVNYTESNMKISRKDERRKLSYLLTENDMIATRVEYDENNPDSTLDVLFSLTEYEADLSSAIIKDFLSYMSISKQKNTMIQYDSTNESLQFIIGTNNEHRITLELGEAVEYLGKKEPESFSLKVNGEHLAKVFNHITYDDEDPPLISLGGDSLAIITNGGTSWALHPIASQGVEE